MRIVWFGSILKTTIHSSGYSWILFHNFRSIQEHRWSNLRAPESTSLCIQPIWEHLGASGRISVAVQSCWVVRLWLPNHFTFCWCVESIETYLAAVFQEEPLEACFWDQLTISSPRNWYGTEAVTECWGPNNNNAVLGQYWTRDYRVSWWFACDQDETWDCEWHNCTGTHSTQAHAHAAATTPKSLQSLSIVVIPPTLTHSKIDQYNWHW